MLADLNESFLWASLVWGSIGSGFLIYGWKQKAPLPLLAGVLLVAVSYFVDSWILMSLASLAIIAGVIWFLRRGEF